LICNAFQACYTIGGAAKSDSSFPGFHCHLAITQLFPAIYHLLHQYGKLLEAGKFGVVKTGESMDDI